MYEYLVKTAGAAGHGSDIEMLRLLVYRLRHRFTVGRPSVFDHIQKFIQILDQIAGVPVRRLAAADLFHLVGDKILHLQHMFHQLHMGNMLGMGFSQIKEHILQLVGHSRYIVKHHDAGRPLDGMHGPEDLVDAVLVKAVRILLFKNRLL